MYWPKTETDLNFQKKGENIDWNYKSNTLDVNEMWEELSIKTKSTIENILEVVEKISKQNDLW